MKLDFTKITSEGIEKLKALLQEYNVIPSSTTPATQPTETAPEQKFGEGKLKDGTVIKWEGDGAIQVGFPVMVIDPANPTAFLPAPDGEMELEDGTIVVTKDGKVAEVKSAVAPVTPPSPEMPDMTVQVAQMESQLKEVNEKFSAVSKEKEKLSADLEAIKAEFESQKSKLEKAEKDILDTLTMFKEAMEMPSANPTEPVQNRMSKHDKLMKTLFK